MSFAQFIHTCCWVLVLWNRVLYAAYRECWLDRQVNDNTQGQGQVQVQGIPLGWYIIIIWLQQLLKIPPPSTTRVNFQVCLVPLPESILESSTGLIRTGSESALKEQLYGFPSGWFKMSQALFCPWACMGGPVWVSVLSLHSSLQEACDLHPTFRCTPSQVSDALPCACMCVWNLQPVPSIQLSGHGLVNEKKMKHHTCRQDHNSVYMHIIQDAGQAEIK